MVIVNYDLDFDEFIHSHIVADLCPLDVNSYLYYSVHEKWNAFRVPLENGSINYKNDTAPGSVSSATYADLPGPELKGESMAEAAMPRLDRAAIQIKNLLFVVYSDVYMMDGEMKWKVLPPLPKPGSHIEFACAVVHNSIVIVGGTTEKYPVTKRITLLKWSVLGKLPFWVKTTLVGFWNGWLYFTSGQQDKGPDNPQPKVVIGELWRTELVIGSFMLILWHNCSLSV
ncbi:hypothetical protein TB2_024144 [Malus domestica]|uniref:Uncharacterized protein n=1 Tax=Malus domestica TaxID=3750 RepID=A0A498HF14_MALDO|nr:hypothetical protein DVH24_027780 [Malus domestica]